MTFDEASGVDSDLEWPPVKQHRPVDRYGRMPVMSGLASKCPGHGLHLAAPRQGTAVCPDALGVASFIGREKGSCLCSLFLCFQSGHWSVSSMRWPVAEGHVQATSECGHWDLAGAWKLLGWSPGPGLHPQLAVGF